MTEELKREKKIIQGETRYLVIGPKGAVDFHCHDNLESALTLDIAGLEVHSHEPLFEGHKKLTDNCWATGKPCYSDGTSLYASERILPIFKNWGEEALFQRLESEYFNYFEREDD